MTRRRTAWTSARQFDKVKDNRIRQWRDQEYRYDPWGNLIEKRSGHSKLQHFSYDCENRLVRAETLVNGKLLRRVGMNWSESLKQRIVTELNGYDVYFASCDVPLEVKFPKQWLGFGFLDDEKKHIPAEWVDFSEKLPWVSAWLDKCVLGTVLAVSDKPYLMYVYVDGGDLCFYMGGAPVGIESSSLDDCPDLPADFKQFYSKLHNGFGFYIGCTMGPSRLEDFVQIKDLCDEEYPALPDMLGVFSSGAGDYLAIGEGAFKGEAFIWWHEKPDTPTKGIDVWDVMDSWMSIFLENSESNENFRA